VFVRTSYKTLLYAEDMLVMFKVWFHIQLFLSVHNYQVHLFYRIY